MSDLGDFKLKLNIFTDNNAFNKALGSINSISSSINHLMGVTRAAAATLAVDMFGNVETAQLKTATALGISTSELEKWNAACAITNTKSASLIADMNSVDRKMQEFMKNGTIDAEFQRNLGLLDLNMGIDAFAKLNADDRLEYVLRQAQSLKGAKSIKDIATIVGDLMGSSASEMFMMMNQMGITVDEMLDKASSMVFTNDGTKNNAFNMVSELNQLGFTAAQIGKLFASEVSPGLTTAMAEIREWLTGDDVKGTIQEIAKGLGDIAVKLEPIITFLLDNSLETIKAILDILNGFMNPSQEKVDEAQEKLATTVSNAKSDGKISMSENVGIAKAAVVATSAGVGQTLSASGQDSLKEFNEISKLVKENFPGEKKWWKLTPDAPVDLASYPEDARNRIQNFFNSDNPYAKNKGAFSAYIKASSIQDGIVKPSGQVVSVAQDDWVFAVKDISRLASAFIPRNYAQAAGGEVSIVQNFTISGSNDIPSVLRQQAYKGTREALLATMQSSALRMQNMPGMI